MGHRRKTLKVCCIVPCTWMDGQGFGSTYYKLYCNLYGQVFLLLLLCFLWLFLKMVDERCCSRTHAHLSCWKRKNICCLHLTGTAAEKIEMDQQKVYLSLHRFW